LLSPKTPAHTLAVSLELVVAAAFALLFCRMTSVVSLARTGLGIALALSLSAPPTLGQAAVSQPLEPLAFLLGDWEAVGGGQPGQGVGSATFAPGLQGRVIMRTSYATYPAAARLATRHDDLMIIYAAEDGSLRADYYDNEGHVIRYTVSVPGPGQASFVSDVVAGAPRYRLSYTLDRGGVLRGEFGIAPPGSPDAFTSYLTWESRNVAR